MDEPNDKIIYHEKMKDYIFKAGLQLKLGVIDLSQFFDEPNLSSLELELKSEIFSHFNLKDLPKDEVYINKDRIYTNEQPVTLMKALGIDPKITNLDKFTDQYDKIKNVVYTEGYNDKWYLLIKGRKEDERLHGTLTDYFCYNVLIVPHKNNSVEANGKMSRWNNALRICNYL